MQCLAPGRPPFYESRMLEGFRLAVTVPAHNEARLIIKTLASIPAFVDRIIVVDDASTDGTFDAARAFAAEDERVWVMRHAVNLGVGAAIMTGYRAALEDGAQAIAVMAGDAQMHPDDLERLAWPVIRGEADYAKGDRFHHPEADRVIPIERSIVGRILSVLTRCAAGLDSLSDSQCGYTVISASAAQKIDLKTVFPRYGYPNDLLGKIARTGLRIRDVPVRPVYGDEESEVRPWHVVVILGIIARIAWDRRRQARPDARHDFDAPRPEEALDPRA
jgi:glycosyltransferase involved in cell wall biosynthesis